MGIKCSAISLLLYTLLCLTGCNEIPQEHREFFRSGPANIEKAIFDYPLDQQIDLMLIGWTKTHPALHLWFQVARNGEPVVPLLIQRMSKYDDMATLRPLARCLYEVDVRHFQWTTHQNYVEMLEKVVGEVSEPDVQREVRAILETGKIHPFFKGMKDSKKVDE